MNQEVIHCAKPSTSIFLESVSSNISNERLKTINILRFSCCIQAGKLTYFTVPIKLCIRVMEFGHLIKFSFPIIRFRIKATKIKSIFLSTINWNPMWFRLISPVWSTNFSFQFELTHWIGIINPSLFHVSRETVTMFIFIWSCISLFVNTQLVFYISTQSGQGQVVRFHLFLQMI